MTCTTSSLVSMRAIGKSFGNVCVLRNVCFDLRPGEVHILAGENGAGKSTLIKILAGVYAEYDGEIVMGGTPTAAARGDARPPILGNPLASESPVRFRSPHDAARHGISVIHQELSLINSMSVVDNIFLGAEFVRAGCWLDYRAACKKAQTLLDRLGLEVDLARPVGEYPVSTRQMIEIAKALAFQARIFVMDEPTSALKDPEVEKLFALIAELKQQGCGIIYISHRMEEIYRIADRITVLRDGQYVGTAPAAELPQSKLITWMVGREITQQFPPRAVALGPERLKVENFCVPDPTHTKRWAVEDVSFSVRAGEILGFAGLQGSGNSELFGGLFGAAHGACAGTVRLEGKRLPEGGTPHTSIRNGLALLTSDRKKTGMVGRMSITRNITLASLARFSPAGWLRGEIETAAAQQRRETLAIRAASLEQDVVELSGGNQQKVILAKWLETHPKVLLLDEPTRGVDVGAKYEIYALMNALTAQGLSILLITSEMPELLAMADRILVMHRGHVTAEYSRGATPEMILRAAMGEICK